MFFCGILSKLFLLSAESVLAKENVMWRGYHSEPLSMIFYRELFVECLAMTVDKVDGFVEHIISSGT